MEWEVLNSVRASGRGLWKDSAEWWGLGEAVEWCEGRRQSVYSGEVTDVEYRGMSL